MAKAANTAVQAAMGKMDERIEKDVARAIKASHLVGPQSLPQTSHHSVAGALASAHRTMSSAQALASSSASHHSMASPAASPAATAALINKVERDVTAKIEARMDPKLDAILTALKKLQNKQNATSASSKSSASSQSHRPGPSSSAAKPGSKAKAPARKLKGVSLVSTAETVTLQDRDTAGNKAATASTASAQSVTGAATASSSAAYDDQQLDRFLEQRDMVVQHTQGADEADSGKSRLQQLQESLTAARAAALFPSSTS